MVNYNGLGTKELITESKKVILREERLNMSVNDEEKEKSHPVLIIGSNNIIGKNVFLINTGSDQETIQEALQAIPPEILDKFLFGMGTEIQKKSNGIS